MHPFLFISKHIRELVKTSQCWAFFRIASVDNDSSGFQALKREGVVKTFCKVSFHFSFAKLLFRQTIFRAIVFVDKTFAVRLYGMVNIRNELTSQSFFKPFSTNFFESPRHQKYKIFHASNGYEKSSLSFFLVGINAEVGPSLAERWWPNHLRWQKDHDTNTLKWFSVVVRGILNFLSKVLLKL